MGSTNSTATSIVTRASLCVPSKLNIRHIIGDPAQAEYPRGFLVRELSFARIIEHMYGLPLNVVLPSGHLSRVKPMVSL